MSGPRPDHVPLLGPDAILLAMSDGMRRRVGHDASCRLVVRVAGHVDPDALGMRLKAGATWRWLTSLRVGRGPDGRPAWCARPDAPDVPLRLFFREDADALDAAVRSADGHVGDPRAGTPVRLDLHHGGDDTSALVLTWHHALMDARGAELLMAAIAEDRLETLDDAVWVPSPPPRDEGWLKRLLAARLARNTLLLQGLGAIVFPGARPRGTAPVPGWTVRTLDAAETAQADARAVAMGAGPLRSLWHLVAASIGVDAWARSRGVAGRDLLVPVPQDRRRRGAKGPIVGNRITTWFYRFRRDLLTDPPGAVAALGEQLRSRMKGRFPAAYEILLDMVRTAPGWLIRMMIGAPTLGRIASFGFSDTGASLDALPPFRGHAILDAWHLPANLSPPGLTIVFSRRAGCVRVCVASEPSVLDAAGREALATAIRDVLCGEAP